jgi:hypothetical protein
MAQFASHYNLFKIINTLRLLLNIIFWSVLAISLLPIILKYVEVKIDVREFLEIANIIFLLLYFFIEIIIDYILIPQADSKRRDDLLDNSFGSNFSLQSSVGYFDNDEVQIGHYKLAVNLFENCFFTYSLIKSVTINKIILPLSGLIVVAVLAYKGFKEVPIALSLLQALFSAKLLGGLIKHFILMVRLNSIEGVWTGLFQNPLFKTDTIDFKYHIYRNWLHYEALHSKIPAEIPEKKYDKYNPQLTQDWANLKIRYNIN